MTGARRENPAEDNCRVTRESECPQKTQWCPVLESTGHQVSSVHRDQLRILGSQRLSSAQLAVTSFSPSQKPTAMPAA